MSDSRVVAPVRVLVVGVVALALLGGGLGAPPLVVSPARAADPSVGGGDPADAASDEATAPGSEDPDEPVLEAAPGEEIVSRRTEVSRTFATATPGEFTSEVFAGPIHYRSAKGWRRIDPTLRRENAGRVSNVADRVDVDVATMASASTLARVTFPGGGSVGFKLRGADAVTGEVDEELSPLRRRCLGSI